MKNFSTNEINFLNLEKENNQKFAKLSTIMSTIQFKQDSLVNRDQNIFLTSTPGVNNFKKGIYGAQPTDENVSIVPDVREVQSLRKNIIEIVVQFKSLPKPIQLSHQFNQILYSLDTHLIDKKTVGNIISSLEAETNVIKLTRLYNRLKMFGKALERVKIENQSQKTLKKAFSSQGFRKNHQTSKSHLQLNATSQTLPSNSTKQNQQWKKLVINEISFRERLQKIQSQDKRHSLNKEKFMKKKLQKVKELNKKASEIYEKNKKLYKQRISKHRYQQLFDPGQVRMDIQRRGDMMNGQYKQSQGSQTSQIEINSDEFITEPKSIVRITANELYNLNSSKSTGKNDEMVSAIINRSTKPKISALMSFTEIANSNVKGLKSLENLNKQQQSSPKITNNQSKINKYSSAPIPKSFSLDRTLKVKNIQFSSKREEQKLHLVRQKKRQLEQQKQLKMITQAVEKQKRIQQISKKRILDSKAKKDPSQTNSDRSFNPNLFKNTNQQRNDLEDKQRSILSKLQSKQQKKDLFLQQRVNKVRVRLQQQEETKEKYRQYVNEYIYLTESAGAFHNNNSALMKKRLKKRQQSQQQNIIKCAYRRKMKQSQGRLQEKKLDNLSLTDLKKKLVKIQNEEVKSSHLNFVL